MQFEGGPKSSFMMIFDTLGDEGESAVVDLGVHFIVISPLGMGLMAEWTFRSEFLNVAVMPRKILPTLG